MPNLRRLNLGFNEWDWGGTTPVGMEHLLSLQNIHVTLRHDTETTDGRVARAFANYAAQEHPCRPSFTINDHRRRRSVDYS
uniref:Uncharacterized protein n=1 Tax=Arundo donax TaxID=35708 RepID=A0A0A9BYV3_ARUDO